MEKEMRKEDESLDYAVHNQTCQIIPTYISASVVTNDEQSNEKSSLFAPIVPVSSALSFFRIPACTLLIHNYC